MSSNLQQQLTQPQHNTQNILINQQPQPPPQQQNISIIQKQSDFEKKTENQTNELQQNNYSKENSIQIPSQFATNNNNSMGGLLTPQKVIIPGYVNPQQGRNVPRRNTVSAKSNPNTSIFEQPSNEQNNKTSSVGASIIPQNTNNPSKIDSIPNNQNASSPRVQFHPNHNSQIQFNINGQVQHSRDRRQSEMTKHNNAPQNQQPKPRRVSEMQPNPNQPIQSPQNNQQYSHRSLPIQPNYMPQNQQNQIRAQQQNQFQPSQIQQNSQQFPNKPYPPQYNQAPNQFRTPQFQQNALQQPQSINQAQQQFPNKTPNQFQQQQNQQQRLPPNNHLPPQNPQIPYPRQRGQTTKTYQQPYGYPRPQPNLPKNMMPQQSYDYSGSNGNNVPQNPNLHLTKSNSAALLSQQNNSNNVTANTNSALNQHQSMPISHPNSQPQYPIPPQQYQYQNQQFQQSTLPPQIPLPIAQKQFQSQNRQQSTQQLSNPQQNQQQKSFQSPAPIPQIQQTNQTPQAGLSTPQPQNQQQAKQPQTQLQQQEQSLQPLQIEPLSLTQLQQQEQLLQPIQIEPLPLTQLSQQEQLLQPLQIEPLTQQQDQLSQPLQVNPLQQQQQQINQQDQIYQPLQQLEANQGPEIDIPPLELHGNPLFAQQSSSNPESASSSPNISPIKIQSDILNYLDQNNEQSASSAPLISPIQPTYQVENLSDAKRVSFDESLTGIIGGKMISSDEANKTNSSDSSDSPIDSTSPNSSRRSSNIEKPEDTIPLTKESRSLDDILSETLLNCPLAHQIDDENCKNLDSTVTDFINSQPKLKGYKWFGQYVASCSQQTNPYVDNLALEYSSKPEFKDNRTVKLFSSSIRHLKLNTVPEDLPAHFFTASSSTMLLNEALLIKDRSKIVPIIKKPIQNSASCYVRKFKTDNIIFKVKDITAMPLPKRRYLNLSLTSYEFKVEKGELENVEPFFLCGYLVNNGEMISEPWFFGPSETRIFNPEIKLNQNASFELPTILLSEVYFVIVILRKLLPDNGAAINKYYKSPGTRALIQAKDQAKYRSAYPGVFASFAWTFLDVDTIVRTKSLSIKMPQPFAITGMIKPLYKSLKSVSGQQIPIDITFRVGLQNDVIHPYELTFTNDCVLSLVTSPPEIPRFSIYHCFYIRIISATLHSKKRNIYAHLTLKKGETELPLIYYPYRIGKSTKNFTKCWYHEKKPIFDDLYVCSLPNPVPPDFMIYIKFYNAVLKNLSSGKGNAAAQAAAISSQASSDGLQEPNPSTSELIGIAKIPLVTEEGDFIPDGVKTFGVLHLAENQVIPGCLTLETRLNSSFISSNPMLNHFYNKIDAETMIQIDTNDAVINLFNLLDQLVIGITTEPEESIKSLVELSRKVANSKPAKAENKTDFISFSSRYATSFSFISDSSISTAFHRNLLRNWALLIEADLNYRISLRSMNQFSPDQNNTTVGNFNSSSNLLSMSNLSLNSGTMPGSSGNNSISAPLSQSSSLSQFQISPRNSQNPVSPRTTPSQQGQISPRTTPSQQGQISPRSSPTSPRNSNLDNYQSDGSIQSVESQSPAQENQSDSPGLKLKDISSSNLLSSDMIGKLQSDCISFPNTERSDFYLIDFFFLLIIKSLYLTNDQDFGAEFSEFTTSWSKSFNRYQIDSYSTFINLLFDIGHYSYACHAIGKQVLQIIRSKQSSELLLPFLQQVLRPKLFYPSVLKFDDFVQLIQTIIIYSKKHKTIFNGIFDIFLRLFVHYSLQMNQEVTSRLIDVYTNLCDYNELPIKSQEHSAIYFYVYLFQYTTFEAFQDWISKQKSRTVSLFFKTLQWLINYVKNPELARVLHFGLLNILIHLMKLKNKSYTLNVSLIVYNLFCCNLSMDFIPDLVTFFGNLVEQYYMWLIESSVPTIARHIAKIFDLSCYCPNEANEFFKKLFGVDMKNFNNVRRSMSICCHSLLFIKSINNVTIFEDSSLYPIVQCLKEYEILRKAKISEEKLGEIKLKRAMILIHSPDATVHCINNLISFHKENEYFAEELQTRIFKIAIVFEYLGSTGVMDWKYLNVERPSLLFADECPIIKECVKCPSDGNFRIPSYCDSPPFSERSLICDMMFLISRTIETKLYEVGLNLIDKFWPIMEHHNKYILASKSFKIFSRCYSESAEISTDVDRLFGRYYRVSFYGKCFNNENGKSYIYREKKLTHLFEISKRLTDFYSDLYQPTVVELIKEAGTVDVSSLDLENKGYIQVTFVEPSFKKKIDKDRITAFEKNHLLTSFFFDTPFTKEGKKAQSTIDQQWIRRTVLTAEHEMPSVCKRVKIINENDREFPPIRVAYRQLRERITMFQNAITQADYRNIQQLLHGSLLVQVNEGPSRMAELFLGDNCEKSKYTFKLESAFKNFLEINEKALEMHGKWVTENPDFVPLQHELESGYGSLVEKLSKWIS